MGEEIEQVLPGWREASTAVADELATWRAGHPRATMAEIEGVVFAALERLQARYLTQMAQASAAADLPAGPAEERPRCPSCGGELEARGKRRRAVLTARQRAPVALERSYGVCTACGAGLFPPR
jgi:hypothetical protein